MKILLINPPLTFFPGSSPTLGGLPLGILYIAAVLDKAGYNVRVLDTLLTDQKDKASKGYRQMGMDWLSLCEAIKEQNPDIVGITNPFSIQIDNAIKVSKIAKEINPDVLTLIGGPHASVFPLEIVRDNPTIDIAVRGEGEYTFLNITKHYESERDFSSIKGIAYRSKDNIIVDRDIEFIENLDELPFPAYHLADMAKYLEEKRGIKHHDSEFSGGVPMVTSRGCPYHCVFCSIHLHMGKKYREHSPYYVIEHLKLLTSRYGVKYIHFEDDNFTFNMKRCEEILDGIIENKIVVHWDTPNGVRADKLTKDILIKMKKSGCNELRISPESGSQRVVNEVIGKNLDLDKIAEISKICQEIGIKLIAFYVIGLPGETKEDIKKTFSFARELEDRYEAIPTFSIATPFYGTRLYQLCKEKGYLTKDLLPINLAAATFKDGLISTEDFTPSDLQKYLKDFRLKRGIKKAIKNPKWLMSKLFSKVFN